MYRYLIFSLLVCFNTQVTFTQDKPAYKIFNAEGKPVDYKTVVEKISSKADVVLFGELHNNPIAHWLELELATDLLKTRKLILGAEMLETDNQAAVDQFLKDSLDTEELGNQARLWSNHKTDYQPLLELAKSQNIAFAATNVPRRYASQVHKEGFKTLDSLPDVEKNWIAPLPIAFDPNLPQYQEILKMMGEHGSPKLVMAQALKDATMAHFILKNYQEHSLVLHYNGAFHSDFFEGILWYLKKERPDLNYKTISTVSQDDLSVLENQHLNRADFIIAVDAQMTSTY